MADDKKLTLQEQLALERQQKDKPPEAKTVIEPPANHILTPQERISNAKLEIEALQAEKDLEAVKKGYADFKEQQKAFETAMSQYPDWQTKEELLNQREIEIKESLAETQSFCEQQRADADEYYSSKIKYTDEQIRQSKVKLELDTKELRAKIDRANKDLQVRIQIYTEIIEPSRTILTNAMNQIAQFLRGQGNPKQTYNSLSIYLQNLENYAEQIKTSVDLSKLK